MNDTWFDKPIDAPYPGLRPFQPHESKIFFGRDEHVADMLTILENHQFLAVVGPSGGGKSSLVLAGLIPALARGELLTARSNDWRFIVFRPGDAPFSHLADALQSQLWPDKDKHSFHDDDASLTEIVLRQSPFGLREAIHEASVPENANVLVVVDQFEELFRFRKQEGLSASAARRRDDSAAFVESLLATAHSAERPIYVMLTMRSDFLGECDVFDGLPQAINQGQYLTPRLNIPQTTEAITRPLDNPDFRGTVEPLLVQRILNDIGSGRDELPVMQHALFRTWQHARGERPSEPLKLNLSDYFAPNVGGVQNALSLHADEAFDQCKQSGQGKVVEKVFRGLCARGTDGQRIRRPATIEQLSQESGHSIEDVIAVVEAFRRSDRSFLMPTSAQDLEPNTKIDISHEALIRQWRILNTEWCTREDDSKQRLLRVIESYQKFQVGRGNLLSELELVDTENWWKNEQPTLAWIHRYAEPLADRNDGTTDARANADLRSQIDEYIQLSSQYERDIVASQAAQRQAAMEQDAARKLAESQAQNARKRFRIALGLLLFITCGAIYAVYVTAVARTALGEAQLAKAEESIAKDLAEIESEKARLSADEAISQSKIAFALAANTARAGDKSIEATHWFLRLSNALKSSPSELGNTLLAAKITGDALLKARPEFGLNATFSSDGARVVSWGGRNGFAAWDFEKDDKGNLWPTAQPIQKFSADSDIKNVILSRDAQKCLSWGIDSKIYLWDVSQSKSVAMLPLEGRPAGAAFTKDGTRVLVWGEDRKAQIWDFSTGQLITFSHDAAVTGALFSRDESHVLTWSEDNAIRWWLVNDAKPQATFRHDGRIAGVVFNIDESRLFSWSYDKTINVWDVTKDEPIETLKHDGRVIGIALNKDESRLLSWSDDKTVSLWDFAKAQPIRTLRLDAIPAGAFLLSNESILSWADDKLYCLQESSDEVKIWKHGGPILEAHLAESDGEEPIVWTRSGDDAVRVFALDEAVPRQVMGHSAPVLGARIVGGGDILTWSGDETLRCWSIKQTSLEEKYRYRNPIGGASVSTDQRHIALWTFDALDQNNECEFWNLAQEPRTKSAELNGHDVQGVLLDAAGTQAIIYEYNALGMDNFKAFLWNTQTRTKTGDFGLPTNNIAIVSAGWSEDQSRVWTLGADGIVRVWKLPNLSLQKEIKTTRSVSESRVYFNKATKSEETQTVTREIGEPIQGCRFSRNGQLILSWTVNGVQIWDVAKGEATQHLDIENGINGAAFGPDESQVVIWTGSKSAGRNVMAMQSNIIKEAIAPGFVSIWNRSTGEAKKYSYLHTDSILGGSLDKDGKLLTWSTDGSCVLSSEGRVMQRFQHQGRVTGARSLREGSLIVTWSDDKKLALWEPTRNQPLATMMHPGPVNGAIIGPNENSVMSWSGNQAFWWNISKAEQTHDAQQRIRDFEIRSGTRLNAQGQIEPLSFAEWKKLQDSDR